MNEAASKGPQQILEEKILKFMEENNTPPLTYQEMNEKFKQNNFSLPGDIGFTDKKQLFATLQKLDKQIREENKSRGASEQTDTKILIWLMMEPCESLSAKYLEARNGEEYAAVTAKIDQLEKIDLSDISVEEIASVRSRIQQLDYIDAKTGQLNITPQTLQTWQTKLSEMAKQAEANQAEGIRKNLPSLHQVIAQNPLLPSPLPEKIKEAFDNWEESFASAKEGNLGQLATNTQKLFQVYKTVIDTAYPSFSNSFTPSGGKLVNDTFEAMVKTTKALSTKGEFSSYLLTAEAFKKVLTSSLAPQETNKQYQLFIKDIQNTISAMRENPVIANPEKIHCLEQTLTTLDKIAQSKGQLSSLPNWQSTLDEIKATSAAAKIEEVFKQRFNQIKDDISQLKQQQNSYSPQKIGLLLTKINSDLKTFENDYPGRGSQLEMKIMQDDLRDVQKMIDVPLWIKAINVLKTVIKKLAPAADSDTEAKEALETARETLHQADQTLRTEEKEMREHLVQAVKSITHAITCLWNKFSPNSAEGKKLSEAGNGLNSKQSDKQFITQIEIIAKAGNDFATVIYELQKKQKNETNETQEKTSTNTQQQKESKTVKIMAA